MILRERRGVAGQCARADLDLSTSSPADRAICLQLLKGGERALRGALASLVFTEHIRKPVLLSGPFDHQPVVVGFDLLSG
jgi:hypothetical protein